LSASQDRVIKYRVSSNTNSIQENWINRIYEYIGNLINIEFRRVEGEEEFLVSLEQPDYRDLYPLDYAINDTGLIRWSSGHNTRQYGGVNDQTTLVKAVGNSLGLARFNYKWREAGNTGEYTYKDTIMADIYDGQTLFFRDDDKEALKAIFNSSNIDGKKSEKFVHIQRIKEDFLIGANGQVDEFRLNAKGMNADNTDATTYDPETGWYTVNDYNVPTIANFNPYEGDKILIDRRLFVPLNPINPDTPLPDTIIAPNGDTVSTKTYLRNIQIDLAETTPQNYEPEERLVVESEKNVLYNNVGKLMLNVNGKAPGHGPGPVTGNGQLLAFVDVVGDRPVQFQEEWLDLWDDSLEQDNITGEWGKRRKHIVLTSDRGSVEGFAYIPKKGGVRKRGKVYADSDKNGRLNKKGDIMVGKIRWTGYSGDLSLLSGTWSIDLQLKRGSLVDSDNGEVAMLSIRDTSLF
jgi:hypothetical protein